ncbi:Serrate RNA effector molecule [Echinococcus granulosus]|uniref:Serrate RNA effector molecule n=1 Tax=Echinococcus granulosus TaxID=6210 RepID=W6UCB3_ECHGR|nr:Serrate RNA effector molecule [Echinococcus granulosus]EUB58321.1 Serrate RNA effector molecule [Echinococcus granulosus]
MGDSDDDNDIRRTRDKFRRERSDVDNRREKREPFDDRAVAGHSNAPRSRPDRRPSDYRSFGGPRDRPSFGNEPPSKRPRRVWNDDHRPAFRSRETKKDSMEDEMNYRPPLMPFKRFLEPLDDFITDEEAIAKYKEYKESFNKRYIEEFFEAHKNEEWLREKYHPDFIDDTREQVTKNIRQRLDVFLDLFDKGMIDNQSVDMENGKNLIKLMDAVVIKLNGGTDDDLAILDNPEATDDDRRSPKEKSGPKSEGEESDFYSGEEVDARKFTEKRSPRAVPVESKPEQTAVGNDWTGVSSESESEERPNPQDNIHEEEEDYGGDTKESENEDGHQPVFCKFNRDLFYKTGALMHRSGVFLLDAFVLLFAVLFSAHMRSVDDREKSEDTKNDIKVEDRDVSSPQNADITEHSGDNSVIAGGCLLTTEIDRQAGSKRQPPRRDLHKTASIFFRCLPPTITRKELEDMCTSQPGFIRLAIYDPMPERRFTRHAWATYEPNANIKKICWALNTNPVLREKWHQGKDSNDLCATVNRELAQRIRPVSAALTRHRPVMRNDLRIASRLVAQLDTKHSLWSLPGDEEGDAVTNACPVPGLPGVFSANPLMRNLTDFLVDETASEEEAMLNRSTGKAIDIIDGEGDKTASFSPIDTDSSLLRALDRLIIYLRIVYSIDYYAATLYQLEDLMPHRCGIFHARGTLDSRGSTTPTVTQREVNDYISTFNEKMANLLDVPRDLTDEEIEALGARDPEAAAEAFIEANIQKRTSKKKPYVLYLLSGFRVLKRMTLCVILDARSFGFVLYQTRSFAIFFNNFLRDPKRPSLPEAPRHLINRFYPPPTSVGPIGDTPGMRGRNIGGAYRAGGGYRGGGVYRTNSMPYGPREYFGSDGSHHGIPATAVSGAANIYSSTNQAEIYALSGHNGVRGGSPRGVGGYKDYNSRKRLYPDQGLGDVVLFLTTIWMTLVTTVFEFVVCTLQVWSVRISCKRGFSWGSPVLCALFYVECIDLVLCTCKILCTLVHLTRLICSLVGAWVDSGSCWPLGQAVSWCGPTNAGQPSLNEDVDMDVSCIQSPNPPPSTTSDVMEVSMCIDETVEMTSNHLESELEPPADDTADVSMECGVSNGFDGSVNMEAESMVLEDSIKSDCVERVALSTESADSHSIETVTPPSFGVDLSSEVDNLQVGPKDHFLSFEKSPFVAESRIPVSPSDWEEEEVARIEPQDHSQFSSPKSAFSNPLEEFNKIRPAQAAFDVPGSAKQPPPRSLGPLFTPILTPMLSTSMRTPSKHVLPSEEFFIAGIGKHDLSIARDRRLTERLLTNFEFLRAISTRGFGQLKVEPPVVLRQRVTVEEFINDMLELNVLTVIKASSFGFVFEKALPIESWKAGKLDPAAEQYLQTFLDDLVTFYGLHANSRTVAYKSRMGQLVDLALTEQTKSADFGLNFLKEFNELSIDGPSIPLGSKLTHPLFCTYASRTCMIPHYLESGASIGGEAIIKARENIEETKAKTAEVLKEKEELRLQLEALECSKPVKEQREGSFHRHLPTSYYVGLGASLFTFGPLVPQSRLVEVSHRLFSTSQVTCVSAEANIYHISTLFGLILVEVHCKHRHQCGTWSVSKQEILNFNIFIQEGNFCVCLSPLSLSIDLAQLDTTNDVADFAVDCLKRNWALLTDCFVGRTLEDAVDIIGYR